MSPELAAISWQGRRAIIAFDSDVIRKADVKAAITALVDKLKDEGADVRVILLPDIEGHEKIGLDDFLVARGAEALQGLVDNARDWFSVLLEMLPAGLAADALDTELQPIYQQAEKAGAAGKEMRLANLRQRLKDLGYPAPQMLELKRASRNAAATRGRRRQAGDQPAETEPVIRFVAEGPDGRFAGQPEKHGLYDMRAEEPSQLTNFVMRITEDVHVVDDLRPGRRLPRHDHPAGRRSPFYDRRRGFRQSPPSSRRPSTRQPGPRRKSIANQRSYVTPSPP